MKAAYDKALEVLATELAETDRSESANGVIQGTYHRVRESIPAREE